MGSFRRSRCLLLLVALASASCLYHGEQVEELSPWSLHELRSAEPRPLVVDLRDASTFAAGHVAGAVNLDISQLEAWLAYANEPVTRPLVVACYRGNLSQTGARLAQERGFTHVFSLHGGMESWPAELPLERGAGEPVDAKLLQPPLLRLGLFEQTAVVVYWFGVKTVYTLFALALALYLRRTRERGLVLVRWSLWSFFVGEMICWVHYTFFAGASDAMEIAHGLGMVGMGALLPWGLMVLVDERVLRYSDPDATCLMQRFCGHCWKKEPAAPCGLRRLFLFAAPALAFVCLMPFNAPLRPVSYGTQIFGSRVDYTISLPLQFVEYRLYPAVAIAALLVAFGLLLFGGRRGVKWAHAPFFLGLGLAGFSLLRFFLAHAYADMRIWSDGWEELTELLSILGVGALLWAFRRPLGLPWFGEGRAAEASGTAQGS